MAPTTSFVFVSVLLLFFSTRLCHCVRYSDLSSIQSVKTNLLNDFTYTPNLKAEKLIRALNLFPKHAINIAIDNESVISVDNDRIVEKQFNLVGLKSGPSTQDLGHYAGYYKLPYTKGARMFYFFFESRNSKNTDPVVIWLTGGPGCSSELALFYENGPFKIANDMSLMWNDYGWDKASNLLYVDQPTGTGFSYTTDDSDNRHDETGVSNDLYNFLQEFFEAHYQLVELDFYITGESYAGHYIPALASRIHQGNTIKEGIHINLKGFAIGNGLTDPAIQYAAYTDFALSNKLINQFDYVRINKKVPACHTAIKDCAADVANCEDAYSTCDVIFKDIMDILGDTNYYDIRKKCVGSLCYDFSSLETLLNDDMVREAIGVGDREFVSCSSEVYQAMLTDWMRDYEVGIPALLDDGIRVLIYAGEEDLICNWLGNSRWVEAMQWSGKKQFGSAFTVPFVIDGVEAGELKTYGPLAFLKVHKAGHMVPMDQPEAALQMLTSWMNGKLTAVNKHKNDVPK